jgi:molybdate transport repressor ModE-like protein
MLDPRRLRLLPEIERSGSFSAAAAALDYTPSAISQQVAALEAELGTPLIERGPRGATLTEAGQVLARHAERIVAGLEAAEADIKSLAGLRSGKLRLGWFATAGTTLIPRSIAAFRALHPGVELAPIEANPDECAARLRDRELDLAVVYESDLAPSLGGDLRITELVVDRMHVAVPSDHRLAGRARISLRELADDYWIQGVRSGSTLEVLPTACRAAGFEPKIAFQTNDFMTVQGLVAAGVGIALIPDLAMPTVRPDIAVKQVGPPELVRRVGAALPPGRFTAPAVTPMLEVLGGVAGDVAKEAESYFATH